MFTPPTEPKIVFKEKVPLFVFVLYICVLNILHA